METREGLLLRILSGDGEAAADEGAVTVANPCLSGGALGVFLDPVAAPPRVLVVGETPIARAGAAGRRAGPGHRVSSWSA